MEWVTERYVVSFTHKKASVPPNILLSKMCQKQKKVQITYLFCKNSDAATKTCKTSESAKTQV